jgi:hypothetical protein
MRTTPNPAKPGSAAKHLPVVSGGSQQSHLHQHPWADIIRPNLKSKIITGYYR